MRKYNFKYVYCKVQKQSGPPLEFINKWLIKWRSATRIHQPSLPLDFINHQPLDFVD